MKLTEEQTQALQTAIAAAEETRITELERLDSLVAVVAGCKLHGSQPPQALPGIHERLRLAISNRAMAAVEAAIAAALAATN